LIREPEVEAARPVLIHTSRRRWSPFWLAPVAAAILATGAYVLNHKPTQPVAPPIANQTVVQQPQTVVAQQTPLQQPATQQPGTNQPSAKTPAQQSAQQIAPQKSSALTPEASSARADQTPAEISTEEAALSQPTAADDNQFLTQVSQRAPTMRATYANQLHALNNEIRETRAYISQYPGDVDARQHLLEVYEQKAMLYQMALDRIQ
jgi:apolipoprotein N-acyltransferase